MQELFAKFVKEKTYLTNVSSRTITFYWSSWKICAPYLPEKVEDLNESALKGLVVSLREEKKQKAKSVNTYVSAINSFLTWLKEEKYTQEHFKIKKLKLEQTIFRVFTEKHIKTILDYKPTNAYEWRLWAILCLLIDTGMRIDECLKLKERDINFESLALIVKGKGGKERFIPFSPPMRKILIRYFKEKNKREVKSDLAFPSFTGNEQIQRNVLKDMKNFCEKLGIEGVRVSPHTLRHSFAIWYLVNGGDLYTLSRILGHSSITVTQIYLRSMGIDLIQKSHENFSPLTKRGN
jgi:integrase/recombinase XerD